VLNISLIQIQYLIALDEHRNFVKAAEASFITQPTLSMQLKKLEDELGVLVFDRSKQPIAPTELGRKIIDQAKQIFKETQYIEEILKDYKGEVSGTLTIGILPTISNALMPHLISQIAKRYHDLKLQVREMKTAEIIDALKENKLDVGIVSTPVKDEALVEEPVYNEKFRVYVNPSHPSYDKRVFSADDLLQDKLWLLSEGNCFRTQSINFCTLPEEKLHHIALDYESGSLQTLKKIVDKEGGLTILPEWEAAELDSDSLDNLRVLGEDGVGREVGIIYTKFYAKKSVIDKLKEMIADSLPNYIRENKNLVIIEHN
jgi:LysR family hydrogen peroxide-inducible transcriptional activator